MVLLSKQTVGNYCIDVLSKLYLSRGHLPRSIVFLRWLRLNRFGPRAATNSDRLIAQQSETDSLKEEQRLMGQQLLIELQRRLHVGVRIVSIAVRSCRGVAHLRVAIFRSCDAARAVSIWSVGRLFCRTTQVRERWRPKCW